MVMPWTWGSVVIILLVIDAIRSWFHLNNNVKKHASFSWVALVVFTIGLGLQCQNGVSLISSVGILLLPMAYFLIATTHGINLKLKTPLLPMLSNPLSIFLMAIGFTLVENTPPNELAHKPLDPLIALHIFLVISSFTVIFLSTFVSVVLLFQDLKLKRKLNFKVSLPSLDFLERIVRTLNNVALIILTCAIGAGDLSAAGPTHDSTFYWTITTWCLLAILSLLHFFNKISGQRFALGNFVVALATIIALLGQGH